MFDNIGEKIKKLAVITCIIGIVVSVFSAMVLWVSGSRNNPTGWNGFLVLVIGILGSWVGSFFTYGLGQLIEDTQENRMINQQILTYLQKGGKPEASPGKATASTRSHSYVPRVATTNSSNGWRCQKCGCGNSSTSTYCKSCGADR